MVNKIGRIKLIITIFFILSLLVSCQKTDQNPDKNIVNTIIKDSIVYFKPLVDISSLNGDGNIIISNFDGANKNIIQTFYVIHNILYILDFYDISQSGKIIFTTIKEQKEKYPYLDYDMLLWVSDKSGNPINILTLKDKHLAHPKISPDGTKITYLLSNNDQDFTDQLWTMDINGKDNKLIIDKINERLEQQGFNRLFLIPVAWSKDNLKIYLVSTSDDEHTPDGLYEINVNTKVIKKIELSGKQLGRSRLSFSPDHSQVAYTTYQLKTPDNIPIANSGPFAGAPIIQENQTLKFGSLFTISVTNLNTGSTREILESSRNGFTNLIWSNDGTKIAYTLFDAESVNDYLTSGPLGLFIVDVNSGEISKVVEGKKFSWLIPQAWLGDRLVYTESIYSTNNEGSRVVYTGSNYSITTSYAGNKISEELVSIKIDGSQKQMIDSVSEGKYFTVFGSLDQP
ncbi:hypothetical protein HYY71_06320 [Candidatus Woesearchaeota archaeon]|nr:hypothetical protein [Candidatus Woesearchaeota archaeon]